MVFWRRMTLPVRRVWLFLSARFKSRKNGGRRKLRGNFFLPIRKRFWLVRVMNRVIAALISLSVFKRQRVKRKTRMREGLLKLHDDIETCGYQDVKIMWEMLQKTEIEQINPASKRKRQFWRVLVWSTSNPTPSSSSSNNPISLQTPLPFSRHPCLDGTICLPKAAA